MKYDAILSALSSPGTRTRTTPERRWSGEQEAFFAALLEHTDHLMVNAVAGSGKTTTALEGARRWAKKNPGRSILFLAFGKVIAAELAARAPSGLPMEVRTIHAFCWKHVAMQARPRVKPGLGRVWEVLDQVLPRIYGPLDSPRVILRQLERDEAEWASSMCRHSMALPTAKNIASLMRFHDRPELEPESMARVVAAAAKIIDGAGNPKMDFDDTMWVALKRNLRWPRPALVIVDEAQDLNQAQIEVVCALRDAGARIVAIGDPDQAIFGWRGALPTAMRLLQQRLNPVMLPLAVTWRCPGSHVELAQEMVRRIRARPGAPEGVVDTLPVGDMLSRMRPGDLVIGRTNAQVLETMLAGARMGLRCTMLGTEFSGEMEGFINRFRVKEIPLLRNRMGVWLDGQRARVKNPNRLAEAEDKVKCVNMLCDFSDSMEALHVALKNIFANADDAIRFSTVHRAKGLESERVGICPGPLMLGARRRWQLRQEMNVRYIALTRAMSELYFGFDDARLAGEAADDEALPPSLFEGLDEELDVEGAEPASGSEPPPPSTREYGW